MQPFAWQYLLFEIPLACGLLLAIGAAFGLSGDSDVEADVDADVDADADHDVDANHGHGGSALETSAARLQSTPFRIMRFLGIGRVPFTLLLTLGLFIFGISGVIANEILRKVLFFAPIYVWGSLAFAGVCALVLTGRLAKLINRLMPSSVTFVIKKEDLVSCMGTADTRITTEFGIANVRDTARNGGDQHQIKCVTSRGEIESGARILVVAYDAEKECFTVDRLPAELQ